MLTRMDQRDRDPVIERIAKDYRERPPRKITQDELNELSARVLRNKMRGSSDVERLERRLEDYTQRFNEQRKSDRSTGTGTGERSRKTEDDMTIEEMLREERTTGGTQSSIVKNIMKDKKYSNDLEYQEENSSKLSKYIKRGDVDLRSGDYHQTKKQIDALERCQLCIENEHCCEMVSMGETVYLTLAPKPELADFTTMIVPVRHLPNTLHCDETEWDEIKQYMVALSKFYYTRFNKAVVFYENSVNKNKHAAITCVPIPMSLSSSIRGYFKAAILEEADDFEQQHSPIIDTEGKNSTDGFRHSIAKEAPYFHVWFTLNGGMGHIVEDLKSWPSGDLFARQVLGGALKVDWYIIKKQAKWENTDTRVNEFSDMFTPYDWTMELQDH